MIHAPRKPRRPTAAKRLARAAAPRALAPRALSPRALAPTPSARERLIETACELFATQGVYKVGIDTILERASVAKATLYGNFKSKEDLALEFLKRREATWTRDWLEREIEQRYKNPDRQLLSIFELFDERFKQHDFDGCSFINVLLESPPGSRLHREAVRQLGNKRAIVARLARRAGLERPEQFAQAWHMLMKGSIVAANEGHLAAAQDAKRAGEIILRHWPRGKPRER